VALARFFRNLKDPKKSQRGFHLRIHLRSSAFICGLPLPLPPRHREQPQGSQRTQTRRLELRFSGLTHCHSCPHRRPLPFLSVPIAAHRRLVHPIPLAVDGSVFLLPIVALHPQHLVTRAFHGRRDLAFHGRLDRFTFLVGRTAQVAVGDELNGFPRNKGPASAGKKGGRACATMLNIKRREAGCAQRRFAQH
jgi:hypothetical protein